MLGNACLGTPPLAALGMNGWGEWGRHKRLTRSSRLRGQTLRVSRDPSDRPFSRFTPSDRPLSPFTPSDRVAIVSRGPALSLANRQPGESRSEEHTSELQSLMRISYAVFCLKKKKKHSETKQTHM